MSTLIEMKTAELMRDKLQARLDALYMDQEANKVEDDPQPKFEGGGTIQRLSPTPFNLESISRGHGIDDNMLGLQGNLNRPTSDWSNTNPMFMGAGGLGSSLLGMAAQYGPAAYNLGRGLFEKPDVLPDIDYDRFNNPYESHIRSLMADRQFNIDPILEGNRSSQNALNRSIRNTGNISSGQYLSNLQAGSAGRMRADSSAYAQKSNVENQYRGDEAGMLNQLGVAQTRGNMFGIPYQYRTDESNFANQASKRNIFGQGLTDVQQAYQTNQLEGSMRGLDANKLNLLRDIFQTNPWMKSLPGFENYVNKNR